MTESVREREGLEFRLCGKGKACRHTENVLKEGFPCRSMAACKPWSFIPSSYALNPPLVLDARNHVGQATWQERRTSPSSSAKMSLLALGWKFWGFNAA